MQRLQLVSPTAVPQGRRAENGAIPPRYRLTEMESCDYAARTAANVEAADATLILTRGKAQSAGTRLTRRLAQSSGKPLRIVDLSSRSVEDVDAARAWIVEHKIRVLNVAGPRESTAPGIQDDAREFVERLLSGPLELPKRSSAGKGGRKRQRSNRDSD